MSGLSIKGDPIRPDYDDAACLGQDGWAWFALPIEVEPGVNNIDKRTAQAAFGMALDVCRECPLALACARYAMVAHERGLWGITESERYYLGGRGFPDKTKGAKTHDRRQQVLLAIMDRFGPDHEVTLWARDTPTGYIRNHSARPVGRPRKPRADEDGYEEGAA